MPGERQYTIRFSHLARKDVERLSPAIRKKLKDILLQVLAKDPYEGKKLLGDLAGSYSYRLTFKDRIVYQVNDKERIIFIERARTYYGE